MVNCQGGNARNDLKCVEGHKTDQNLSITFILSLQEIFGQTFWLEITLNLKQIPSEELFTFSISIRSNGSQTKCPQNFFQAKCIFFWGGGGGGQISNI